MINFLHSIKGVHLDNKKRFTPLKLTKEEIIELILSDPSKTNIEWGNEWGVSRERVRQLRVRFGIPSVKAFNHDVFNEALKRIENGYGNLNASLFNDMPNFGLRTLKNWMANDENIRRAVESANQKAYNDKYHPLQKMCSQCEVVLPIDKFYSSKTGRDKKMHKCIDCDIKTVKYYYDKRSVTEPTVDKKQCAIYKDLGELPAEFFHKSRKTATGLQYTCKQYGKAYSKYKNMFLKANAIDNPSQKIAELKFLGDWKQKAYNEGKENLIKDLEIYNAKVEGKKIFG